MKRTDPRPLLAAFVLALGLAACGRPFIPATPPGFVDLGDRYAHDEYRATTPDGAVLGIRAFDNDPKGDLGFWSRAIENRMRETGGYALLDKRPVKAGDLAGTLFRFGHDEGKEANLYYVTVFVDDKHVFVLEAGGPKAQVERFEPQIEWAIRNFRAK
jgi:hypothetical protein